MKKLPPRIAALTPSITVGLILIAVGLTALLAYRAFDASRSQQQMTEHTLREYAGFAAYQLRNAASGRMVGQHRGTFEHVVRAISMQGSTPPLGPERVAALIAPKGPQCGCLDGISFYYQVTIADSGIEATASELATPANLGAIRERVIAHALAPDGPLPPFPSPPGPRPPGVPPTSQWLASLFVHLDGRPYLLTHAIVVDSTRGPVAAYGFVERAEEVVGRAVSTALQFQPILPNTLTRGLNADSILAVTVTTPAGAVVYRNETRADTLYAATDSLEPRLGGLRFEVAIDPASGGLLILGGLPRSRLPEVIATACVAVGLLGMLLYLFRRQEELARLRDEFVSGVSHELRTPLAQIRLLAELLHMGKVPAEEQDRSLRIIDKEARRLSFLVDSILSFTHTRRGELSPVSTDIAAEIDEIVSGFAPLAEAHGVRLTTRLEPGIVASVDRSALRQVVLNLLDNAVRYGPSGQDVTVSTRVSGDTWTLEVADQGPGIPAEERERIFTPYYRLERDTGGAVGGTGIGLAVVRRLVEEHRGRVHVASTNGDGTPGARFVVALPIEMPGVNGR